MAECCQPHEHAPSMPGGGHAERHVTMVTDPVCEMKVDIPNVQHRYERRRTPYHFCTRRRDRFAADVGIAIGTAADVVRANAAITLVNGDLGGIVKAIHLSGAILRNVRQNLFFAFLFNSAAVPTAAGVLYPWVRILLSRIIARVAMALSAVTMIGNSLQLHSARLK